MRLKNPEPNSGVRWPPHPRFEQPNDDEKVWRYMDFTKFVSLLDKSALYFPRAATLTDKWEGSYPLQNSFTKVALEENRKIDHAIRGRISSRDLYYISCWYLNEYESAAMWDLYSKSNAGVAIQSTYQCLRDSITDDYLTDPMYFTKIKYIDYQTEKFAGPIVHSDGITAFFHKRKSFEHEKEFRIITTNKNYDELDKETKTIDVVDGLYFPVKLSLLLQTVYVAPGAKEWFKELIKSVLQKYNLANIEVKQTDLDKEPLY